MFDALKSLFGNKCTGAVSLLAALALVVAPVSAANVAWVSFHEDDSIDPTTPAGMAGFTDAPDIGYTDLLAANGHTVTRIVGSGTPDTALLSTFDLVIVGRSNDSGNFQSAASRADWHGITAPMIYMHGWALRTNRLGYTTGDTMVDTAGSINLTASDPNHPIFAGIDLDGGNTMVNPFADIVTIPAVQRGISVNNDPAVASGTVLATVGTAADPTVGGLLIGEWQTGASMFHGEVLGGPRMVFLSGSREVDGVSSQTAGIFDLIGDGGQLFLNAVDYMAIPEPTSFSLLALSGLALLATRRRR